jgi:hypothetical protein
MSNLNISSQQIKSMAAVANGADVYNYGIALDLREVKSARPELIKITKPQAYSGDGTDEMPYFGAILTDLGRDFVAEKSA